MVALSPAWSGLHQLGGIFRRAPAVWISRGHEHRARRSFLRLPESWGRFYGRIPHRLQDGPPLLAAICSGLVKTVKLCPWPQQRRLPSRPIRARRYAVFSASPRARLRVGRNRVLSRRPTLTLSRIFSPCEPCSVFVRPRSPSRKSAAPSPLCATG